MREIRRQRQKTHSVKKMKPENFLVFAVAFLCSLYSQGISRPFEGKTCDVRIYFLYNHHGILLIMCNSLFLIEQTLQRLDLCRVLLLDGTIYVLVTSRGHQQEGIGKQLRNHRFHTLKKTKQKITK